MAQMKSPEPEFEPQGGLVAIVALVLRILRGRGAAEESTLDVFTQAWKQAGRYEPSKGSPLGWLLTMARSRAIDLVRSRGRQPERETMLDVLPWNNAKCSLQLILTD